MKRGEKEEEEEEGDKMIFLTCHTHVSLDKGVCVRAISFPCLFDTYHRMLISIRFNAEEKRKKQRKCSLFLRYFRDLIC